MIAKSEALDPIEAHSAVPQGPGSRLNADQLGGYKVSRADAPAPNTIVPLDGNGRLSVPGTIVQTVYGENSTYTEFATTIPIDDTIPQITEGGSVVTVNITPTKSTNRIVVMANTVVGEKSNTGNYMLVALFKDGATSAIAATVDAAYSAANTLNFGTIPLQHSFIANTTSEITLEVRAGGDAGTYSINGFAGARYMGGVMASTITVMEVTV